MAQLEENNDFLKAIRKHIGVTQEVMSELMGVPKRTYEDLETGKSAIRRVHLHAAMFGCLLWAEMTGKPISDLPEEIQRILNNIVSN